MNRYIDVEVQEEENKALKDLILTKISKKSPTSISGGMNCNSIDY